MDAISVGVVSTTQFNQWKDKKMRAYLRSMGTRSFNLLKLFPLALVLRFGSTKRDCKGLGFDSGNMMSSERDTMRA